MVLLIREAGVPQVPAVGPVFDLARGQQARAGRGPGRHRTADRFDPVPGSCPHRCSVVGFADRQRGAGPVGDAGEGPLQVDG